VALTEAKIKDLEDKKFDALYKAREAEWKALAKTAREFAKKNITGGKDPRPDDIAEALRPMLRINDALRAHQEDNQARARRYLEWFVEYVIDQALL
jgi:hypothetical protein